VKSFRSQLILSHLLPLIIVLPLLGLIFIIIVESQILLTNVVDDLRRTAVTVATQAAMQPTVWQNDAQAEAFVAQFSDTLQREVILLQPDGSHLASQPASHASELPPLTAADLAKLRDGQPLTKSQYNLTLSDLQAEAFVPVLNAQQVVVGIVRVTDRLGDLYQSFKLIRILEVVAVLIALGLAIALAWGLTRRIERRLSDSEQSLRRLSLHLLRTQDEERRRIGRDLHDSVGQYLAVLKMRLDSLSLAEGSMEEVRREIFECIRLAEDSITEVRTVSYLLYPPMLDEQGLKSAVPWYLDGFSARSGIHIGFDAGQDFGRLPRESELALFRVLQESLTNVHRHSGSQTAHVRLFLKDGFAILQVEDKGSGISPDLLKEGGEDSMATLGVGLRGMNERMQQLGGKLELVSTKHGTTVSGIVPAAKP